MKKWHPIAITLGLTATVLVLGCGSDESGLAQRYSVSGKVTYKGEPVPKGGVTFEPVKPAPPAGRHASGTIENGYYTLTTSTKDDGALPGDYKVVIIATTVDMTELAKKTGGLIHQGDKDFVKIVKEAKSLVPEKYTKGETTPLKVTVKAESNRFDLELTD
jgi:major membrane immunogen (membrane-anchored lipoprotein)